jgi:hypothetical protein
MRKKLLHVSAAVTLQGFLPADLEVCEAHIPDAGGSVAIWSMAVVNRRQQTKSNIAIRTVLKLFDKEPIAHQKHISVYSH